MIYKYSFKIRLYYYIFKCRNIQRERYEWIQKNLIIEDL